MTSGAWQEELGGDRDLVITAFDSHLTRIEASTFVGGRKGEVVLSAGFDGVGSLFIAGWTESPGYPTTPGAHDRSFNGERDIFVTKLSSGLDRLLASTFLGGAKADFAHSMGISPAGEIYITGYTRSRNYPTTQGTYNERYNGGRYDIFLAKFDNGLHTLEASTFFGGHGGKFLEEGSFIALDRLGNAYITGTTYDSSFPTTQGAHDENYHDRGMAFVSKFDGNLKNLLASTFLGGIAMIMGTPLLLIKIRTCTSPDGRHLLTFRPHPEPMMKAGIQRWMSLFRYCLQTSRPRSKAHPSERQAPAARPARTQPSLYSVSDFFL